MKIDRAFTVKPIWGWLIMEGIKDVENRWTGVVPAKGICAVTFSKTFSRSEYENHIAAIREERLLRAADIKKIPSYEELKLFCGKVVGVVDYDVRESSKSKWYYEGNRAWLMFNPRRIAKPFSVTGFIGMWKLKPADGKEVESQLKALDK